jgi:transcriptional antiterminator NusG
MQDEHEKTLDDSSQSASMAADAAFKTRPESPRADDGLGDDAESNRSDDTALEDEIPDGDHENENGQVTDRTAAAEDSIDKLTDEPAEAEAEADTDFAEPAEEGPTAEVEAAAAPPARAPAKKREPEPPPEPEEIRMDWYILKVQSNRERSISEALERKMRVEGLDRYFDQVIVPTEKVTEFKGGKKKVVERKLYPGYIVVHMHINDDTWFAVRETSGVGDFTGAGGKPTPMLPHEVARIVQTEEEETSEAPKLDIKFSAGDKVKVKEGNFENFEGEVSTIDEASGRVVVMINIFGRSTPVELEYWQIEMM